jgi:hypothetical protein
VTATAACTSPSTKTWPAAPPCCSAPPSWLIWRTGPASPPVNSPAGPSPGAKADPAASQPPSKTPSGVDEAGLAEALAALPGATIHANQVTAGKTQLRLGTDGLWYRFDQHFNDWTLTRPPSPDPQDLVTD